MDLLPTCAQRVDSVTCSLSNKYIYLQTSVGSINTLISVVQRSMFTGQEALNVILGPDWMLCFTGSLWEHHEHHLHQITWFVYWTVRLALKYFHPEKSRSFSIQPLIEFQKERCKNWQWYEWKTLPSLEMQLVEVCLSTFGSLLIILSFACWLL